MGSERKERALYVRVPADLKEWLGEFGTKVGMAESAIVTSLIQYLRNIEDDLERERVLQGPRAQTSSPYSFYDLQRWVDHAYEKKRWSWVVEYMPALRDQATELPGVVRWLNYRESHAWINFADRLRRDALSLPDEELDRDPMAWELRFRCAERAIRICLELSTRFLKQDRYDECGEDDPHPVVAYNIACCHALLAAIEVERVMGTEHRLDAHLDEPTKAKRYERLKKRGPEAASWYWNREPENEEMEEYWANLGRTWRSTLRERHPQLLNEVRTTVETNARQAIQRLAQVFQGGASSKRPASNRAELISWAAKDPDLLFLRHDTEAQKEYGGLESGGESLPATFDRLWELLSSDVKEAIERSKL